jgi:hypothetical protein
MNSDINSVLLCLFCAGVGTDCDIITSQNVSVTSTVLPVSGGNVSFQLSANVLYWIQGTCCFRWSSSFGINSWSIIFKRVMFSILVDPGVTSAVTYRISGCGHANFSLLPLFTSLILMICFSIGNNLWISSFVKEESSREHFESLFQMKNVFGDYIPLSFIAWKTM